MKTIIFLIIILSFYNVESVKFKKIFRKIPSALKKVAKETWRGFKNGPIHVQPQHNNNFSPPNWSGEYVIRAQRVERPLQGDIMKHLPINHHGTVLYTSDGNSYLLHNTPDSGVVITDTKYMKKHWKLVHDIPVIGEKTVGDTLGSVGTSSFGQERCGYIKGGTCIGTANNVEKYLQK